MSLPRPFVLMLVSLILCSVLTSCMQKSEGLGVSSASAETPERPVVPVAKVVRGNLASNMVLTGEFVPYQEIDVMAKEAGYIKSIRVDIGDRVHTGELLAELEIPEMQNDMARAAAGVEAAQSDIATAQSDLNRAQSSYDIAALSYQRVLDVAKKEPGLVPQQEVDVAHSKQLETSAQVSAAKANLDTAQRKLAMARADQARWATLQRYTIITAPFTGVITRRFANTGAMIQQGTASDTQAMPVVRLSQNNLLRLMIPVPESAVSSVHTGALVDVKVSSLQSTFQGRVTRFEEKIAMSTRTMNTEIDVQNPDYRLVPGMYAEVDLRLRQSKEVLTVPLDAVAEDSGESGNIYAVRNDTIHEIPVALGIKTAQQIEIRSGVREGDLVIVGRHAGLQEGEKVQPKLVHFDDVAPSQQPGS